MKLLYVQNYNTCTFDFVEEIAFLVDVIVLTMSDLTTSETSVSLSETILNIDTIIKLIKKVKNLKFLLTIMSQSTNQTLA